MTGRTNVITGLGIDFSASRIARDQFAIAYAGATTEQLGLIEQKLEELAALPHFPKIDGTWIFGSYSPAAGRINLVDHIEAPLDIGGTVTWTVNQGLTGNVAGSGIARSRRAVGDGAFQQNSATLGVYIRPPIGAGGSGWVDVAVGGNALIVARSGSFCRARVNGDTTLNAFAGSSLSGQYAARRLNGTQIQVRPPGGSTAPGAANGWETLASTSVPVSGSFSVLGSSVSTARSGNQIAGAWYGGGMTDDEVAAHQTWEAGFLSAIGAI